MADPTTEQTWVTVKEAAELTGYTAYWMKKWVRDMFALPENERTINVREESNRYLLWLPDLVEFVAKYAAGRINTQVEEIWVTTNEGMELTGYSRDRVWQLAKTNWELPENERIIKTRRRSLGYELWLPDLIAYISDHGHGPYQKSPKKVVDKSD
jgi:predicted DNA-binding transcriptional regulator AlpA